MFSTVFMLFLSYTLSLSLAPQPRRNNPAAGVQQTQPVEPPAPAEPPAKRPGRPRQPRRPRRASADDPVQLGKRTRAIDDDGHDEDGRAPWRGAEGPAEGQEGPPMVDRPAASEGEPMAVDEPAPPLAQELTVLPPASTHVRPTTTRAEGPVRRQSPCPTAGSWTADSLPLARTLHPAIDLSSVTMGTRTRYGTLFPFPWDAWKDAASRVTVSAPAASPVPFTSTPPQPGPPHATTTTTTTIRHHPTLLPPQPSPPSFHNPNPEPDDDDDIPAWAYDDDSDDEAAYSQPFPSPPQPGPSNFNTNHTVRGGDNDIPAWAYDRGSDDEAEGARQSEFRGRVRQRLSARRMPLEWGRDLVPEGSGADKGKGRAFEF